MMRLRVKITVGGLFHDCISDNGLAESTGARNVRAKLRADGRHIGAVDQGSWRMFPPADIWMKSEFNDRISPRFWQVQLFIFVQVFKVARHVVWN